MEIEKLVRESIRNLVSYSSARSEFSGKAEVFLDANENSLGAPCQFLGAPGLNRYPDTKHSELKARLAKQKRVNPENIFLGNGSDEGIDLLHRVFCEANRDSILIMPPTYGMYQVCAQIQGAKVKSAPLDSEFQIDLKSVYAQIDESVKLLFICSPNNPTGNLLNRSAIKSLLQNFEGIVVIDEAYIDFAEAESCASMLSEYPSLVVLQTLSKAWGLAGIRLGLVLAHPRIIELLDKVRYPYNLNVLSTSVASTALERSDWKQQAVSTIRAERERVSRVLADISSVEKIFRSDANFLLVKFKDSVEVKKMLQNKGVIVRDRDKDLGCERCLRLTIGTSEENNRLLTILSGRSSTISRVTNETTVSIKVQLDGSGDTHIHTGLGFFDHMLEQLAKHSGVDFQIAVSGDLQVDEHHSIEDTAIALGEALRIALGDKCGIERYGFVLPMDEARAEVLLDLSGRAHVEWEVELSRDRVGEFPCEMLEHFFRSLSTALRCTLHVRARGENDHHIIEGVFKAFARALKQAVLKTGDSLPTTKGQL